MIIIKHTETFRYVIKARHSFDVLSRGKVNPAVLRDNKSQMISWKFGGQNAPKCVRVHHTLFCELEL